MCSRKRMMVMLMIAICHDDDDRSVSRGDTSV